MYLQNKYTKCYYNIVNRASSRVICPESYTENHHILPRSLGGSDEGDNMVRLTAREHFICHLLLPKFTAGNDRYKMVHALWFMANTKKLGNRYKPSSRIYESARLQKAEIMRSLRGDNHPNYGKKHPGRTSETFTSEWKAKIAEKARGRTPWNVGIPRTASERSKMSVTRRNQSAAGLKPWNTGKTHPEETRQKIKEANTGKKWVHNPNNPIERKQLDPGDLMPYFQIGWILGTGPRKPRS